MNFKLDLTSLMLCAFILIISCSENKSPDEETEEPELVEHLYFEGKLDNEPFLIEKKFYKDFYSDGKPFSIDYGGTLMNCSDTSSEGIGLDCYTIYASGIAIYESIFPDEEGKHDTAKMYFGKIDVDQRVFDQELEKLEEFLQKEEHTFRRDFGPDKRDGFFAFDFFPANEENELVYYSSRLNNNEGYTAKITSVEVDNYFYIIEGSVETCKLYKASEERDENQPYKLLTDFKFRARIKADFNYNNYKDD